MSGTKRELRADLRTEVKQPMLVPEDYIWLHDKGLENLTLIQYMAFAGLSYPIRLSLLLISVKVYRGHGSLGNNYLGQLMPSAWSDFLF